MYGFRSHRSDRVDPGTTGPTWPSTMPGSGANAFASTICCISDRVGAYTYSVRSSGIGVFQMSAEAKDVWGMNTKRPAPPSASNRSDAKLLRISAASETGPSLRAWSAGIPGSTKLASKRYRPPGVEGSIEVHRVCMCSVPTAGGATGVSRNRIPGKPTSQPHPSWK